MKTQKISNSPPSSSSSPSSQSPPTLPQELIAEILSRLPAKSLLKFKCVSKSWRSLISTPHFITAHLQISQKDSNFTRKNIVSAVLQPSYGLKQSSLQPLMSCGPLADAVDLDYPMKNPRNLVRIVGCCDGLVCIAINGKNLFILNPCTRRYKRLPDVDDNQTLFITKYGFGFDECNEDYKILGVFSGFCGGGRYETVVKIYSLRTNSWKKIECFNDGLPFDDTAKFVGGKLHWGRRVGVGFNSRWEIVSFDLGSEKCETVEQPEYVEGGFSPWLGLLGGCLCVVCDFAKTNVDFWVMKEYGVRESWVKIASVAYHDVDDVWKGPYLTPLCFGPEGEILLVYGSSFMVYDMKGNCFRRPKMRNFDAFLEADVYTESLVSLGLDGELEGWNRKGKSKIVE